MLSLGHAGLTRTDTEAEAWRLREPDCRQVKEKAVVSESMGSGQVASFPKFPSEMSQRQRLPRADVDIPHKRIQKN